MLSWFLDLKDNLMLSRRIKPVFVPFPYDLHGRRETAQRLMMAVVIQERPQECNTATESSVGCDSTALSCPPPSQV